MIEILLALVAAFRRDWGWWVLLPLGLSIGSGIGLIGGPEAYKLACLLGYIGSLILLALMAVYHRRGLLGD